MLPDPMSRPTILCVDDYETSLGGWCLYLQSEGYLVTTAQTAQEGLQLFAVSPVDLVLLDYALPDSNGDDVAAIMKRIKPDVRILMFSGVPNVPDNARLHVDAFLQKGQAPTVVWRRFASCSPHPAKRLDRLGATPAFYKTKASQRILRVSQLTQTRDFTRQPGLAPPIPI
jgi:CheY-like chemotaxis protein